MAQEIDPKKIMTANLSQKRRNEIERTMNPILEDILGYDIPNGTIREEFFVSVFLPYFAGETNENDFPEGVSMRTWNQIAGNFNNPVDVVDNNGHYLYTVPPLNDLSYIVQNPDTIYKPMASAGAYASTLRSSSRPDEVAMADSVINKELNNRIPVRLKSVKEERYREWAKIFIRYGYFVDENTPPKTPTNNNNILDDIEWE